MTPQTTQFGRLNRWYCVYLRIESITGDDSRIPSLFHINLAELRQRLEISMEFNLVKFYTACSPPTPLTQPPFFWLPFL